LREKKRIRFAMYQVIKFSFLFDEVNMNIAMIS